MWQSYEVTGPEESLDDALPGLANPFYRGSDRNVAVDCFFFVRNECDRSTLHISSEQQASQPVFEYLETCTRSKGIQISPGHEWRPSMPLSDSARAICERFSHHSSQHSLYLLTRPKDERLARMCFFDAMLAYHFLRSESAVREFFREHAEMVEKKAGITDRKSALQIRDRVYRPLRAMFHFMRTRKKPLARRLQAWNRVCREIADNFLVMSMNNELIFSDHFEPGTGMKRVLTCLIEEHHARLCYSEVDKAAIARGISGLDL